MLTRFCTLTHLDGYIASAGLWTMVLVILLMVRMIFCPYPLK